MKPKPEILSNVRRRDSAGSQSTEYKSHELHRHDTCDSTMGPLIMPYLLRSSPAMRPLSQVVIISSQEFMRQSLTEP